MTNTLSLRQLEGLRRGLVNYHYYTARIVPLIAICLGVLVFLVATAYYHHQDIEGNYQTYHPFSKRNLQTWTIPAVLGLGEALLSALFLFLMLSFCKPNSSMMSVSQTGHVQPMHAMRYINTAIHDKKYEVPHIERKLQDNNAEYQKIKHPSDFEKHLESHYVNSENHKMGRYENYINNSRNLKIHTINYF